MGNLEAAEWGGTLPTGRETLGETNIISLCFDGLGRLGTLSRLREAVKSPFSSLGRSASQNENNRDGYQVSLDSFSLHSLPPQTPDPAA